MTTSEIQILVSLLNRLPMSPAEAAWAQAFIAKLQGVADDAQNTASTSAPAE